jgi:Flp pilus assembly CpaF family ATPase
MKKFFLRFLTRKLASTEPVRVVIVGPAVGSGKTTTMAHVLENLSGVRHLIAIEDTPELRIAPAKSRQ